MLEQRGFRASIIIGAGSLSFEMIRSLVERLPIMITPRWVRVTAQPIAIDDVLEYLASALDLSVSEYRIYGIGGSDQVSYADIMRMYTRQRGIRLRMISVRSSRRICRACGSDWSRRCTRASGAS